MSATAVERSIGSEAARGVPRLGAWVEGGEVCWRAWAPGHARLEVVRYGADGAEAGAPLEMVPEPGGYFAARAPGGAGQRYKLRVDGEGPFPDPWSRAQPDGVHGPSQVVAADFAWTDAGWRGLSPEGLVLYEVHVGTATPEGTFDALVGRLDALAELGVTALELMPLASFPGTRNWGYDGVALFAPQASYGGPAGLRRLVDAAHARGLGVVVDAVYNHFGPDGNYLRCFNPAYFTDRHHTPWGDAVNYDGADSAPVRELVLSNVEMWIRDYHVDGLRLDAAHEIRDDGARHLLQEIAERARAAAGGRGVVVIAEDDRNDTRLVRPPSAGGWGLDGVWADDLHHQLRRAFAGDTEGYYADYSGSAQDVARTLERGWFYEGQHSAHAGRPRGTPADGAPPRALVHCIQNHDQVGNRPLGDRLGAGVSPAAYRAMSALLLASPYTPLLFMGQEWNASTPFQYFTDHEPGLGRLVTEGRRKEFAGFKGFAEGGQVPDPQAPETFVRSRLDWAEAERPAHAGVRALYRELLRLRREHPALRSSARGSFSARAVGEQAVVLERRGGGRALRLVLNVHGALDVPLAGRPLLWTEEPRFGGAQAEPPVQGGRVRLRGPAAVLLEDAAEGP